MKKILTAIVTLMMLAVLACGAVAEDVTGEWYAEVYGMVMKMTVNADNTYVLEAAGQSVTTSHELLKIRRRCYVGEEMELVIWRKGERMELTLQLEESAEP